MSAAMSSSNFANMGHDSRGAPSPGLNAGFKMPLNPNFSVTPPNSARPGGSQRLSFGAHSRTGSASQTWNRQSLGGALSFGANPSLGAQRLPTHSEQSSAATSGGPPSRSTSSSGSNDPIVTVDPASQLKSISPGLGRGSFSRPRRESVSADKALREVEKALQSVETKG
jgi:hypothetical protein